MWILGLMGLVHINMDTFDAPPPPLVFVLTGFDCVCFRLPVLGCFY